MRNKYNLGGPKSTQHDHVIAKCWTRKLQEDAPGRTMQKIRSERAHAFNCLPVGVRCALVTWLCQHMVLPASYGVDVFGQHFAYVHEIIRLNSSAETDHACIQIVSWVYNLVPFFQFNRWKLVGPMRASRWSGVEARVPSRTQTLRHIAEDPRKNVSKIPSERSADLCTSTSVCDQTLRVCRGSWSHLRISTYARQLSLCTKVIQGANNPRIESQHTLQSRWWIQRQLSFCTHKWCWSRIQFKSIQ